MSASVFSAKKPVVIHLDGANLDRFHIMLLNRLAQTSGFILVKYTIVGGTTPLIWFQFVNAHGLEINSCASNVMQADGFHVTASVANVDVSLTPGRMIGTIQNAEIREFDMIARNSAGVEHHHTTNKLFDTCILEFEFMENPAPRNPLYLNQVPTIQRTMDTI